MALVIDNFEKLLSHCRLSLSDEDSDSFVSSDVLKLAEALLADKNAADIPASTWHDYLNITGRQNFLAGLGSRDEQYRWADTAVRAIQLSNYSLLDMFTTRAHDFPEKILFQDLTERQPVLWSYHQIDRWLKTIAALFNMTASEPRVAIISANNISNACADMASLFYGIFVTQLNVHFDEDTILWICDKLGINIVIAGEPELYIRLRKVRDRASVKFNIFTLFDTPGETNDDRSLMEAAIAVSLREAHKIIANRSPRPLTDVATVMFTSGSTGRPKGVAFSEYNLVSKRFCRAAALPNVGHDEVLLCYLPLFHTFGRFFELLGAVYWGGTYVFPGNPSSETLMALLAHVNPSGLISVPLRWIQIQERCQERMEGEASAGKKYELFREVVGGRLHWGISAAGYLAPNIFKFFNNNGVALTSGFGMTEATGGITMTPPGEYKDNSIGIPLPGIKVRLSDESELQVSGHYIARYLDDLDSNMSIPYPGQNDEYWLKTGDLFREIGDGHLEIVDRVKDIYKNTKGQTIAPRRVEKKFENVPGIKRTFLVGDARAYNVLLIVPDREDPVMQNLRTAESLRDYFHQIVSTANQDLAPYERVVNFAVSVRDFSVEKGELTPKGSYKRKAIEANFQETIAGLYRASFTELNYDCFRIRIPRWFYRDLSILEDDVTVNENGLKNLSLGKYLNISASRRPSCVQIGDLEYELSGDVIDLGIMARHPGLWIGNRQLVEFCPVKAGWDSSQEPFTGQIFLPDARGHELTAYINPSPLRFISDQALEAVNHTIIHVISCERKLAVRELERLGETLEETDERLGAVIRRRIVALADHQEFAIRSLAYRILLLNEPTPDYSNVLPSFVNSGKAFLDENSIRDIALSTDQFRRRKLEALRQRLFSYRSQLDWPASTVTRQQFIHMLRLMANFAKINPQYYDTVRSELASWILHKVDPELSSAAENIFTDLYQHYESVLADKSEHYDYGEWEKRVVFGDEITRDERQRLREVFFGTTFLKQSIMLAFDEDNFELNRVRRGGIWISRIVFRRKYLRYRVAVNTISGKHYDLQIILDDNVFEPDVMESVYWLMSISSFPYGARVLPRLGCCRPELKARSMMYMGELTVWEKIREYSGLHYAATAMPAKTFWRKLFIRAFAAIFRAWQISGRRIVPGSVSPDIVMVPQQDYREGATILSLTGWKRYERPLSLVRPIIQNFYRQTIANYPWTRELIDIRWIFDACMEEIGSEKGPEFLESLLNQMVGENIEGENGEFTKRLRDYIEFRKHNYYVTLPLYNAIDRYNEWTIVNPGATAFAREQIINELWRLYRLDRLPEIARYHLYRHTYFADSGPELRQAFDLLLQRMFRQPDTPAMNMIEISDLQALLKDEDERRLFSRLLFPRADKKRHFEISAMGESDHKYVIVRTTIKDTQGEAYTFREPVQPSEIGQLYRLFFKEGYPKTVTERDRFLVVVDAQDQVVGGLCYRRDGDDIVHIDGSVISTPLMGRGIGSALVEDFCTRMANQGIRVVKTHFFLRRFYAKRGFRVDTRWGSLVRFLDPRESSGQQEKIN